MTTLRFQYQREGAEDALHASDGLILNVGANDDPAHLKALNPDRVINCDLFDTDQVLHRPNAADVTFDCAQDRWPFKNRSAALVILGDILEHLTPAEISYALKEARRVGRALCITVPEDHRDDVNDERADSFPRGAVHRTIVTEAMLRKLLYLAGWRVREWQHIEYDNGVHWGQQTWGHFVSCT